MMGRDPELAGTSPIAVSLRYGGWFYRQNPSQGQEELYSRDFDRFEFNNLANWPSTIGIQALLRDELAVSMTKRAFCHDTRPPDVYGVNSDRLSFWFDGADQETIISSTSSAFAWQDKSGNCLNAVQRIPDMNPEAGYTNGKQAVYFDGNDLVSFTDFLQDSTSAFSLFFAVQPSAADTLPFFGLNLQEPSETENAALRISAVDMTYGAGEQNVVWPEPFPTSAFTILSMRKPHGGSIRDLVIEIDGVEVPGDPLNETEISLGDTQFGLGGSVAHRFEGFIGEAIAFRRQVSQLEAAIITGALRERWESDLLAIDCPDADCSNELSSIPGNVRWVSSSLHVSLSSPYPNPSSGSVSVDVLNHTPGELWLSVYDLRGRLMERRIDLDQQEGVPGKVEVGRGLAPGVYVISIGHSAGSEVSVSFIRL
jgi:hypothetical protein